MHKHTKLAPAMRREIYEKWKKRGGSLREVAATYHVDKRVIQRIIERGRRGDFSVHDSTNHRFRTKTPPRAVVSKKESSSERPRRRSST